jgi:hypothetical protein
MRSCQLCGAKSWGPVKESDVLETRVAAGKPLLECDGCGALAREDLLADIPIPSLLEFPSAVRSPFPNLPPVIDYGAEAGKALQAVLPHKDPETRTERLVHSLIGVHSRMGSNQSTEDYGRWLVVCASGIDAELQAREAALSDIAIERIKSLALVSGRPRDFTTDFLTPALEWHRALSPEAWRNQVGLALDCAIAFGALEGQTTNSSLKLSAELEGLYWEKVDRLHKLVYGEDDPACERAVSSPCGVQPEGGQGR